MVVSQTAISMRNMMIHLQNFSNTPILVRDGGDGDDDEWWMMNDEWWMMNGEWWMMNDEWWIIVDGDDDDDDDDDFLRWFNNILGTDQKFKLRVECNLEQKQCA